ncbi:MAG: pyrroline-5-carboxylate reductase [Planctomycetes bacterium]|nr:pyrroline-5-carboxylate reductase [Planctomycetota bacterium]
MLEEHIGFLGSGQMAEALMRGFLQAKLTLPEHIIASDAAGERLEHVAQKVGIRTTSENRTVVAHSRILILAVKPNVVSLVLREVRDAVTPGHLVVSIAAGVTLAKLEGELESGSRVVRVMPNTPCLVGAAAAGFALGRHATDQDRKTVEQLFGAVGRAFCLDEKLLDPVTGLSGSGPAYTFIFIEALADGGVRAGLPRDVALSLAAQTVLGAAQMVLETRRHPGELKDMVASPGGTTIAGIHEMEKAGFRGAVMNAVLAASERSRELGK